MEKRKQQLRKKTMNVEEIHAHALKHMKAKFKYLSEQRQLVIKYIIGKLKKFGGAFFQSHKTIANEIGLSVSTVRRAIESAKKLGILTTEVCFAHTENDKMRQTSNNIILLPFTQTDIKIGEVVAVPQKQKQSKVEQTQTKELTTGEVTHVPENEQQTKAEQSQEDADLFALYKEYKAKGVSKQVFNRLLDEIRANDSYTHLIPYFKASLDNVVNHRNKRSMSVEDMWKIGIKKLGITIGGKQNE